MKTFKVRIEKMVQKGLGLGYKGKLVVFVPYAVRGDVLKVRVEERKKDYVFARIEDIIEPSPLRTEPFCPYFPECGGCQWQMIAYKAQLDFKREIVKDALEHIAKISEVNILPVEGMESPYNYRNKVQFPLKRLKNRKVVMGFYRYNTHHIVDIDRCPLHLKQFDGVLQKAKEILEAENITIYNENRDWGKLKNFTLRGSERTDETLLVLVTRRKLLSKSLASKLKEVDPRRVVGVVENLNPEKTNRIFGKENYLLWGRSYYYEKILNYKFVVSATSFFQVNTQMAEKMAGLLEEELKKISPVNYLVDAYSGVGLFTLVASRYARKVTGVEISSSAVRDALKNIEINEQLNIDYIEADAEDVLPAFDTPDVLVLDPPRKGTGENVLNFIRERKPRYIFYISCNPPTLARDLGKLVSAGYEIEYIKPFDFFPHTFHVEVFTKLFYKGGK